MIGATLSHFRITAKLGEGGMGEVYRAEDTKLGREVAVKVLPQAFVADPERLARFEREARVLATLNHPHIAGIYEVGEDDGCHFLVMELAEGRPLDRRLAEGPVPLDEARIALERILAGELEETAAAEPTGRRARRLGAVAAAAAVLAAIASWLVAGSRAPEEVPRPLRKLDLVAEGVVAEWFTRPSLSPDGARIAYNAEGGIWIRDLDRLEPRRVATVAQPTMLFWSPDSRSIGFGDAETLWRVGVDGGRPTPICRLPGTGSAVGAAWHEDGRIAIASWRGPMYVVPAGGGRPEPLFEHDAEAVIDYHDPLWLPDGRLLFTVHHRTLRGDPEAGEDGLAVFDGSTVQPVEIAAQEDFGSLAYDPQTYLLLYVRGAEPTPGLWARPVDPRTLRPTGPESLIVPGAVTVSLDAGDSMLYMEAASARGVQELVLVDRAGTVLAAPGQPHPGLADPALSPDGRRVAFTAWSDAYRELWVLDLERGTSLRLTFGDAHASIPMWLPDSERVVYSELRGMSGTIVTRRADGTGGRAQVLDGVGYGLRGAFAMFAPGRHFLAAIDEGGPRFLRIADVDEAGAVSELRRFFATEPDPRVLDARLSPDGSMLAYTSADAGRPEIYLTRFPGGEGRWQVSFDGGHRPRWAAQTGELFFLSGTGSSTRALSVVEVESAPSVRVGTPRELFRISTWGAGSEGQLYLLSGSDEAFDVTPDGERFLMARPATARGYTARMVLVQNWRRELPQR